MTVIPNLNASVVLIGANVGVISQEVLDSVAPARTFDIHGFTGYMKARNTTLLAIGKLVTELAQLCNFTPKAIPLGDPSVIMKELESNNIASQAQGILIPFVVPSVVSPHFAPLSKTKASVVLSVYQYFNFLYCDQSKDVVGIDMKVILLPFDKFCWSFLILSCILITAFGSVTIFPKDRTAMALTAVGALFLQPIAPTALPTTTTTNYTERKSKKNILLLLLWLTCCFVLNNLYSGAVTSLLVKPIEPDVIKTVDDLVSRNYRLAFNPRLKYVFKMTEKIAVGHKRNSSLRVLLDFPVNFHSFPELIQGVAFKAKLAMYAPYMATMSFWQKLTEMNKNAWRKSRKPHLRNRRCHLGKKLSSAYSLPEMWIFRMKHSQLSTELGHTFSRLDAVGVHQYWMKVFWRLQTTTRAQNVYIFKSNTEVKQDIPVEPLNLYKGSIVVIFVLYAVCILACLFTFCVEMFLSPLCSRSSLVRPYY